MVRTAEAEITIQKTNVPLKAEGPLPEKSMALEVEVDIPSASPEVLTPAAAQSSHRCRFRLTYGSASTCTSSCDNTK